MNDPTPTPEAPFVPTTESVLNSPPKPLAGVTPTIGALALNPPPPTEEQQVSMKILRSRNIKMFSNRTHRQHNRKHRRTHDLGKRTMRFKPDDGKALSSPKTPTERGYVVAVSGADKFSVACAKKWGKHADHAGRVVELVRTYPDRLYAEQGDPSAMGE